MESFLSGALKAGIDFMTVVVSKDEIQRRDTAGTINSLKSLLENPQTISKFREHVDIVFDGYNDDTRELWEIQEVRDYIRIIDEEFPYWLFFLSKECLGLACIIHCFLPPFLTPEGKQKHWPPRLSMYLERRGFPAMNHLCAIIKCEGVEIDNMTERFYQYWNNGVLTTK